MCAGQAKYRHLRVLTDDQQLQQSHHPPLWLDSYLQVLRAAGYVSPISQEASTLHRREVCVALTYQDIYWNLK